MFRGSSQPRQCVSVRNHGHSCACERVCIQKVSPCKCLIVHVGSHSPAPPDMKQTWRRSRPRTSRSLRVPEPKEDHFDCCLNTAYMYETPLNCTSVLYLLAVGMSLSKSPLMPLCVLLCSLYTVHSLHSMSHGNPFVKCLPAVFL